MSSDTTMTVIVAAKGYPGTPAKGGAIRGVDAAERGRGRHRLPGRHGRAATGGWSPAAAGCWPSPRVAETLGEARERAYRAIDAIDFADGFHRRDIGWRELERAA